MRIIFLSFLLKIPLSLALSPQGRKGIIKILPLPGGSQGELSLLKR
jgi:hypothetical protein